MRNSTKSLVFHSRSQRFFGWFTSLLVGAIAISCGSVQAAEQIVFSFGTFELYVSVDELSTYGKEERIGKELDFFLSRIGERDRKIVREFLNLRTDFSSLQVSQFLYSSIGEDILAYLGELVQTDGNLKGAKAIRAGLILAAAEPDGLSLINFLRKYPSPSIRLNLAKTFEVAEKIGKLVTTTDRALSKVENLSAELARSEAKIESQKMVSLANEGQYKVKLQTEILKDYKRDRQFIADIYFPQGATEPLPVIVLSHGLTSDRQHFASLAKLLASYGFVAVSLEHPGSNSKKLNKLLKGLTKELLDVSEFIDCPKDVSYVLDELAQRFPKAVNVKQSGVVGHSFGGYTALALAGAVIDFDYLTKECSKGIDSANFSLIFQCQALKIPRQPYNLRDDRIQFALVINPIDSSIFGPKGMAKVQIPLAIVASSQDAVAPAVLEQIRPFSWMTSPDRYLFVIRGVGHTTDISYLVKAFVPSLEAFIPDKNLEPLKEHSRTLAVALVQTYVANRMEYRPYLQAAYAFGLSQAPNTVSVLRELSPEQFNNLIQ